MRRRVDTNASPRLELELIAQFGGRFGHGSLRWEQIRACLGRPCLLEQQLREDQHRLAPSSVACVLVQKPAKVQDREVSVPAPVFDGRQLEHASASRGDSGYSMAIR